MIIDNKSCHEKTCLIDILGLLGFTNDLYGAKTTVRDKRYNIRNSIDCILFHVFKKIHHATDSKHILMLLVSFEN